MSSRAVAVANEQVSIVTACRVLGMDLPSDIGSGRSRKVPCPFGEFYHSDGGIDPAMRIYPDTNSAFCFACSAGYTPVALTAQALGLSPHAAAQRLLDVIGYRPLDLAGLWAEASGYEPAPDTAMLADALKTYCRRIAGDWSSRQFDPPVAATLTRCLGLLDLVSSASDVELWLSRCKTAMAVALKSSESKAHVVLLGDAAGSNQEGLG